MAESRDKTIIRNTHAVLLADTRVYDASFELSPTDTADAGKHKLCDGTHTYAQLGFIEDGGGVSPASALTQAEVDGIQASTDALTGINAVVSAQELGNSLAANSSNRIRYQFDTATGDADPGAGKFRLNNGTIGSATLIYISETDREGNALSALLDTLGTAGTLVLRQFGGTDVASFTLGAITDASGYKKIGVTLVQGSLPANDDEFILDVWGNAALIPKTYMAHITDLGTATPSIVHQFNPFGGSPTFTKDTSGEYHLTLTGAFTLLKTYAWANSNETVGGSYFFTVHPVDADRINVFVLDSGGNPVDPSTMDLFITVTP